MDLLTSDVPGEIISAAIGVGIPEDPSSFGTDNGVFRFFARLTRQP